MKLEIIYNEGDWILLDGAGKVIEFSYGGGPNIIPSEIERAILEYLGKKDK